VSGGRRHLQGLIWDCLRKGPAEGMTRREVAAKLHIRLQSVGHALQVLKASGQVIQGGGGRYTRWAAQGSRPTDNRGLTEGSLRALQAHEFRPREAKDVKPFGADGGCDLQRYWSPFSRIPSHRILPVAGDSARPQESQQAAD